MENTSEGAGSVLTAKPTLLPRNTTQRDYERDRERKGERERDEGETGRFICMHTDVHMHLLDLGCAQTLTARKLSKVV